MRRHLVPAILCAALAFALAAPLRSALAQQPAVPPGGKSPLQVFILAGQSNMEGQGVVDLEGKDYNQGRGTLAQLMRDPAKLPLFKHLKDTDGKWVVRDDVWVRYQRERERGPLLHGALGFGFSGYGDAHHFGPELQFGHVLGDYFTNQVLLIKTAWGGKSLYKDFRPPSSGGEVGPYYTKMLEQIRETLAHLKTDFPGYDGGGYEVAGFVWYHGWNDGVSPKVGVPEYETNLVNLIRDVRQELKAPRLPFVIGELTGPWVEAPREWTALRQAQAAAAARAEFAGNVLFVETHNFVRKPEDSPNPSHGHHEFGNAETYFLVGDALGKGMVKLLQAKASTSTTEPASASEVTAPPAALHVPSFYKKFISANGYPIVASERVNDYALQEAAFLVNLMLARRPDVREAMIQSGSRLCVLAHDEFTTDPPEFKRLARDRLPDYPQISAKDYWDTRARGTGGSETDPYCTCAEENLLGFRGDPYAAECILIHEFAHNIHLRGMVRVDPTFDKRLKATYSAAMKTGLWKGKYASVNHHEYFAEGVQSWFDNNRVNDHDHNHVNTRALLLEYDPGLAAMCREVFGDTMLKYTKPATRLTGHMAGYDPAKAPAFVWPARLQKAKAEIRRQAEQRDRQANGGETNREVRHVAGWTVNVNRRLLDKESAATARALELLKIQLEEIVRVVPSAAVAELQKVPLWFSPEYPGVRPSAEFHPGADWLRENGRDPIMVKGVEFTNVRDFEKEMKRMPNFALHELAHAYHDRVLARGFDNAEIKSAYERAKASASYDKVERWLGNNRSNTREKAYAMTNPMEYFAESTEAFFSRNDFFPFDRAELAKHDPEMERLLAKLWGVVK